MPSQGGDYRDFQYPLNVFMHILTAEEGEVSYLHYGIFEREGERLGEAQERSTALLLERLPPPPAVLLEAGIGLGTTLTRLAALGYEVEGITPDASQVESFASRHGVRAGIHCVSFEEFEPRRHYDAVFFQESSQYIDSDALFSKADRMTDHVVVLDEFSLRPLGFPGALHEWQLFVDAAARAGYRLTEGLDLSAQAAPTMDYFRTRIPRWRERLVSDLGITGQQIDELIESGARYRDLYARGDYGYRLAQFRR